MNTGLDAIKKAKKTGVNYQNGEGVRQKKVTFLWGPARKSGGITPLLQVSHNPNSPTVLSSHNQIL
jgi:hypothetical protein